MTLRSQPSVSVIVPVYDVAAHLPSCLDSLVAQTFDDFEVVIVDDGSTDGSRRIAEEYVRAHPDSMRLVVKPHGGLGDARNAGIDASRGRHLAFVDGDDAVEPEMLERMTRRAAATGADFIVCGIRPFDAGGDLPFLPEPDMSVFGRSLDVEPRLLYRVDASACTKLVSRDLVERSQVRFPVGMAFEDLPTVYRWLAFARRVEKLDEPLYRYRQEREGSITAEKGARFLDLVAAFEMLDEFYRARGLWADCRDALLRLHLTHLVAGRYPDLFLSADGPVRGAFLSAAFALLDDRFGQWRDGDVCRALWPNPLLRLISTRRHLLASFTSLPSRLYRAALSRLGAFDPLR